MSLPIKPLFVGLITSNWLRDLRRRRAEQRRRSKKQPHLITVYLRLADPHSYLLLQVMEQFAQRYPVEFDFRTVLQLQPDMYPAPSMWDRHVFADCQHLAQLYQLDFPTHPPQSTAERDVQLTAQLLHWELQPGYLNSARQLFAAYWQGQDDQLHGLVDPNVIQNHECYSHHLAANQQQLKQTQ